MHRKLKRPLRAAPRGAGRRRRHRLGARRVARVRLAADRGHAGAPHRPGHRARHLQPAPPGAARREDRRAVLPAPAPAERARRRSSCTTARCRRWRRSASSTATRVQAPGDARAVGGAVRRLRERRAGDHRPVHRLRPREVGPDLAPDAAAAARLRGLGPGALERAPRALPAARRRGQHPRREPHHAGAVLPPAAPPGAGREAAPADRDDAQEPAAPAAGDDRSSTSPTRSSSACSTTRASTNDKVTRLVLCSGKVYYDLVGDEQRQGNEGVAIARVELLYPFPQDEILELIDSYPNLEQSSGCRRSRATWAPARSCRRACMQILPRELKFDYIGRPERASTAEGYPAAHARSSAASSRPRWTSPGRWACTR